MGYFKTPDNRQLYELTLSELVDIYKDEKARVEYDGKAKTEITEIIEKT